MEWSIQKILAPTDFSELSLAAHRHVREFARRFGAEVHLLNVLEPIVMPGEAGMTPISSSAFDSERQESSLERLRQIADSSEYEGIAVDTWVGAGRASSVINLWAEQNQVDLIVIATHGRTGLGHLIFGSTAERVVREAPCPVLTVRPEQP